MPIPTTNLEIYKRMVRNLPVRLLLRKNSGEPYAWEANAGNLRDPLNGVYRKHRGTFNWNEWGSAQAALDAANAWIGEMKGIIKTERNAVIEIPVSIRPRLMYYVERCKELGYELDEVFRLGLEKLEAAKLVSDITFREAAERTILQKKRENKSSKYVSDLRFIFNAFGESFDETKLGEINAEDIEDWLDEREVGPVTWNNYRRVLGVLWSFACDARNGWAKQNVVFQIKEREVKTEAVSALTVKQAAVLLATAHAQKSRLVPYLCLGMFAGLRRSEAQLARWEDIDWEAKAIQARGGKMRSASDRFVDLPEVFIDWMKPVALAEGPICTGKFARRKEINELRDLTFPFDGNIFRHSYGSYHYGFHKNANLTAAEMGHESVQMLMKRYRRPFPKEVCAQFWALTRASVLKEADPAEGSQRTHPEPGQSAR